MSLPDFLNIVPGYPAISFMIWFLIAIVMLYLARFPAHRTIKSLSRIVYNGMRSVAESIDFAEKGTCVGVKLPFVAHRKDKVYIMKDK